MSLSTGNGDRRLVTEAILDASAVMAFLLREPGADLVATAMSDGAVMSTVNLSEVIAILPERGFAADAVPDAIGSLPIEYRDFQESTAFAAAALFEVTRGRNISFADRACLALGREMGMPVMTGDRPWAALNLGGEPEVILIR